MSPIKKLLSIAGFGAVVASFTGLAIADPSSLQERLAPVGEVCMAGEECASPQTVRADTSPRTGQQVYEDKCAACHATGAAGAPRVGQPADWEERLAKGMDTLYENAWNGINGMPPKGLCMDCSREEVDAAVDYMVEHSQ